MPNRMQATINSCYVDVTVHSSDRPMRHRTGAVTIGPAHHCPMPGESVVHARLQRVIGK